MAQDKQQKPQGDMTGRAKQRAEKEAAETERERQDELTMVTQRRAETDRTGIHDPVTGELIAENDDEIEDDVTIIGDEDGIEDFGVQTLDEDADEKMVVWRPNGDYPNVTVGVGNTYNFEQGKKVKTPVSVYLHMEEKGCVWH